MKVCVASPWVPPEWIKAHGHEPFLVAGVPRPAPVAVSEGVCAYAEMLMQQAMASKDSAFVFTTQCDQLRRSFDKLRGQVLGESFLFNLPATLGNAARLLFQDELRRLSRWLVRIGGSAPDYPLLARILNKRLTARDLLLEAAEWCPARRYVEALARFHLDGEVDLPGQKDVYPTSGPGAVRLALVGGPFLAQHWSVIEEIESVGGAISLNGTEAGERSLGCDGAHEGIVLEEVSLEWLANRFFDRIVDVFQRPNDRLIEWLREKVTKRRVRGVVLWHYLGCDLWRAEAQTFRDYLNLPVIALEAEEFGVARARQTTRLQAFVETLVQSSDNAPGPRPGSQHEKAE